MHYKIKRASGIIALVLLVCSCHNAISQSGWYQLNSGTSVTLNSVSFLNDYLGYMVGENLAIKTSNGGLNWFVMPGVNGGNSIKFISPTVGFIANGSVKKTVNGGLNWTDLNLSFIRDISFVDANTGWAVGEYSSVYKTTNGGQSWSLQPVSFSFYTFKSVFFLDALTGFIVGGKNSPAYAGVIYKTTTGGLVWKLSNLQMQDVEFRSVYFPDLNTGYIVGGDMSQQSGVIFKSVNSGENWYQQGITYRDLNCVYFINSNTGYAVGEDGMVLKTVDGSILWNSQLSNTDKDLNSVYFVKPDVGFTAGDDGNIQKTLNGGTQGAPFTIEGQVTFSGSGSPVQRGKVIAVNYNHQTGAITGVDTSAIINGIYRLIHIPLIDSLDIMAYQDDELCDFAFGFSPGTIYWSNSGTIHPTGNLTNINIVVDGTQNTGGSRIISGGVFASIGGTALADARIYALIGGAYINVGHSLPGGGYAIKYLPSGSYNMICDRMGYRSATKSVIVNGSDLDSVNFYMISINPIGISNENLYLPMNFALGQNYPNPFNPVTNIRFDVPKDAFVRLSVFDILGREVEILVNQQLKPGTYKYDWHAEKYSSGLYFYKLLTNDFIDVKKMILVK